MQGEQSDYMQSQPAAIKHGGNNFAEQNLFPYVLWTSQVGRRMVVIGIKLKGGFCEQNPFSLIPMGWL